MSLTKIELYLLKEVLPKIKYDKLNQRYILYLEDYISFNLKASEIKVLRRLCQENDIFLEELPKILSRQETHNLFEQYNQIKEQIKKEPNNISLQEKMHEIRNKIVEGHMKLMYKLIYRYFPQINEERDKEDIYQIGYECLIELVDKYDSSKNASFIFLISNYAMQNVVRKAYKAKGNITNENAAELKRFKIAKSRFEEKYGRVPTTEELVKVTGLNKDKLEHLFFIERFFDAETIDYDELENIPYELIEHDFESREIDIILEQNNHLRKALEFLPETHRRVIRLYYGFEDGKTHTNEEVASIIGNISAQRTQQIREHAIYLLSNSLSGEYLKNIYGTAILNAKQKDGPRALYMHKTFVEDLFIESISNEELLSIINELAPNYKEIMLLYYGLKDGTKHDYKEISKILKIDANKIRTMRNICVDIIIKKYIKRHKLNVKNANIHYLVNDYLNNENKRKH